MDNLLIFLLFKDYQENFRKNIINIKFMNFSKIFAYKKTSNSGNPIFKLLIYLLIFLSIFVLIFNIVSYDQKKAYDYDLIYWYIQGLPYQIPTPEQNPAYYHPPLPYLLPSIADSICDSYFENDDEQICDFLWHKISMSFQGLLFLGSLFFYYKIYKFLLPKNLQNYKYNFIFVLFFLLPTLNYKTFVMIRAEPYLVFLTGYLILTIFESIVIGNNNVKFFTKVGIVVGLMLLTKQSSIAIIVGLLPSIFYIYKRNSINLKKFILLTSYSVIISFLVGGWFYLNQYNNYGSVVSFPRESAEFKFSNHGNGYYTDFDFQEVTNNPVKYHDEPRLLQILYTDTWGDYWGYFSFDRSNTDDLQYMDDTIKVLSNTMMFSLIPSLIFITGFIYFFGKTLLSLFNEKKDILMMLCVLVAIFTFLSFVYFITVYPYFTDGSYNYNADTIKSVYIAPVINLLSLFGSLLVINLDKKNSLLSNLIVASCFIIYFLNLNVFTANI